MCSPIVFLALRTLMGGILMAAITKDVPFVRSAFNYDRDAASRESGFKCVEPSLARESFKDECDINKIVERFGLGFDLPEGLRRPSFGDFSSVHDFHSAMNAIAVARESFDAQPAHVRARFNNDPEAFVAFCDDEANRAEAEKMGLVDPEKAKARRPAPEAGVVNPTPGGAPVTVPAGPEGGAKTS